MRFADEPEVSVGVDIAADSATVWNLATDINVASNFSDEFKGAHWLDGDTGPRVGARFHGRNETVRAAWEVDCTVIACETNRHFEWAVGNLDNAVARWWYTLEPTDSGVHLTHGGHLGPGPSRLTTLIAERPDDEEILVERRLEVWRNNMQATVEGIRRLAEQAS